MTVILYRNVLSACRPVGTVSSYCCTFCTAPETHEYRNQQQHPTSPSLPSLPVPPLTKTVEKFLNLAKPIQTASEYEETIKLATNFLECKHAHKLQYLLEVRARKLVNWLTPWWLNAAYLSSRTPLPVVTSPGITFPKFPFPMPGIDSQLECAAKIIQSALKYHHRIINDELPVDKGPGGVPFDMSQYKLMFGTTRIPKHGKDQIRYGKDQSQWATHILVTRNGHSFNFPVYNDTNNVLGIGELITKLRIVVEQSEQPVVNAVNIVSSNGRETWAAVYERLKLNSPKAIDAVENALFVVSLDRHFDGAEKRPEDRNMAMALHGGGSQQNTTNRWFDKTLQFHINENGYGGITYEHTPAEGPPLSMMLDFICDQFDSNHFFELTAGGAQSELPHELNFTLDPLDLEAIKSSEQRIDSVIQNLEVRSLKFNHFGKNVPKRARLSPDSWIQLALQLTYYRLHGAHPPAYETGSLRKFAEGRTDTVRMPSMKSKHFVEAIYERMAPANEAFSLMEEAIAGHKQYSREVMNGLGMDRHLLGLCMIAAENNTDLPALLQSDIYRRLMHFLLSTSQVPTVHTLPMGFGPSAPDCYGVCYNPQESRIFFTITAFNECTETSAEKFSSELERSLLDMRDLADRAGRLEERATL